MEIRPMGRTLLVLAVGTALVAGCGDKKNNSATPASAAPTTAAAEATAAPSSAAPTTLPDNGVAKLQAKAIYDRARAALKSAKSFQVTGRSKQDGQQIAIKLDVRGADAAGTLTIGKTSVQLLKVGGKQYLKPDEAFWKAQDGKKAEAVIQLLNGRWMTVSASDKNFGPLFSVTDINQMLPATTGKVTKTAPKTVGDTPAIGVINHGSDGGTLWVATVGTPYPLQLDDPTDGVGSTIFSKFGATFTDITAPAAKDAIDFSKLNS